MRVIVVIEQIRENSHVMPLVLFQGRDWDFRTVTRWLTNAPSKKQTQEKEINRGEFLRVLPYLWEVESGQGVLLEHASQQVLQGAVDLVWNGKRTTADVLEQPIDVVTLKRVQSCRNVISKIPTVSSLPVKRKQTRQLNLR